MKQPKSILLLVLTCFLLIGCSSNEHAILSNNDEMKISESKKIKVKQEDLLTKLGDYETIKLEDKDEENEITIEYPKFAYPPLDDILSNEMDASFEMQTISKEKYLLNEFGFNTSDQYRFTTTFDKPIITKNFVSIYFEDYQYMGGAHGMLGASTFNFDLKNERIITIHDVMKEHSTNLEVISKLVAQKLITAEEFDKYREKPVTDRYKQSVKEETMPVEINYSTFTLTEDSITFYKQYYSIFPNAAGIVGVEIKWDEVETYMNSGDENTENILEDNEVDSGNSQNLITYKNDDYHFTLSIPSSWEGKYTVQKGNWNIAAEASYDFNFTFDGEVICNIFSINILDVNEDELGEDHDVGPMTYITGKNGKTFTYSKIMELPEEFMIDEKLIKVQDEFLTMVNDDVSKIVETISFE
ncbi:DUF3298 and DUF4163 domain-containing protein [Lederbergia citrea]|uniref:DUF3298 and DUF4163 domain-containing protein n=1 Tax=Lederbergia citrea TaxID=2833581 RepID=UPI001BC9F734|nr:DUF3298 and DUF4163 domain-containing protein [Lederbergia citrea]MBS4178166.1 DUF3298 domain-containing protein [Lederbergia citrea]